MKKRFDEERDKEDDFGKFGSSPLNPGADDAEEAAAPAEIDPYALGIEEVEEEDPPLLGDEREYE